MTDNSRLFVDLSSNNALPNLKRHYRAGHRILALKATEATSYTWSAHAALADEWHRLGGTVWHYHFGRGGSGHEQAAFFLKAVAGHLGPDDVLVFDAEVTGVDGKLVADFLDVVHDKHRSARLMIYGSAYFLRDHHIKPVYGAGLWIAGYPTYPFVPPGWHEATAHQFADNATVTGVPGKVDCSRLLQVDHAAPTPPPKPKHRPTTEKRYRRWKRWVGWWHR